MKNVDVRIMMGNVSQKEIAAVLGVTEMTISRWFNKCEMNEVKRHRVVHAIQQIQEKDRLIEQVIEHQKVNKNV